MRVTLAPPLSLTSPLSTPPGPPHQLNFRIELDTGILSFRARDEPYAINYDAVLSAVQWGKGHTQYLHGPPSPPGPANAPPPTPLSERLQSHASYWLTMVYETRPPGGNVLTEERLAYIAEVERKVRAVSGFEDFCHLGVPLASLNNTSCRRWVPSSTRDQDPPACPGMQCVPAMSLMSFEGMIRRWFIELVDAGSGAANSTAGAEAVERRLEAVGFDPAQASAMAEALAASGWDTAEAYAEMPLTELLALVPSGALTRDFFHIGHEPGWFFDKWYATGESDGSSSGEGVRAVALRSGFEFALPLAGYATNHDRQWEQDRKYRKWAEQFTRMLADGGEIDRGAEKVGLRVLHAGGGISEDEAAALVLGDLLWCTAAFALVTACLFAYSRKLWWTVNAIVGISLSFPVAFFFFRAASASPYVSFLNMLVPFVLIGIGCDDAMLMFDAFRAAIRDDCGDDDGILLPSEDVFAARYAPAARAMLATSLTTAVAFGSNFFSFIPPVRALGMFAALTVFMNYLLVLTLLPAALVIGAKGFKNSFMDAMDECLGVFTRRGYTPRQVNESAPPTPAQKATYSRLDTRDTKPSGGEVELQTVQSKTDDDDEADWTEVGVHDDGFFAPSTAKAKDGGDASIVRVKKEMACSCADLNASIRAKTAAATTWLGDFVIRRKWSIIAAGVFCAVVSSAVIADSLVVARTPPPLLREDQNLQRIQHLLFDVFYTENWSNVRVAFGVAGVDRSGADPNDPTQFGDPVWDESFARFNDDEYTQLAVLAACDAVTAAKDTLQLTPSSGSTECVLQAFVRDSGGVDSVDWGPGLPSALARWSRDLGRNWRENLGWAGEEGSSELKFITADYFVDLHPVASTTEEIRKVHDAWEAVVAAARTAMASRLPQGSPVPLVIQACDVWNRMGVEESIGYTARISPAVSAVACSLIMLVATRSWRVTVAAVGTIAIAVLGMLAALVSLGWEFGVVEELCVTLLVGSSIDYCIHLAMAYAEGAPSGAGRDERVKAALAHMAPTLTGAAMSTAASSAMLLACVVEVLVKIGATIVANTAVGFVLSLFLFSALMAAFGD